MGEPGPCMIPDIFSSFDPSIFKSLIPTISLILIINLIIILIFKSSIYPIFLRLSSIRRGPKEVISAQLYRTQSNLLKGISLVIATLFLLIIFINLIGVSPYSFSLSSHLIITLSFGLPLWLGLILSSFSHAPKASTAHFLPDGTPDWLNPFLVLIERTRVLVRPLTLSFRLAANITAGHIVLGLIGIYCSSALLSSIKGTLILTLIRRGYILFEFAICLIQAYIFCLLLTLYRDDHAF
jgi:ATP synthase subunit 6